jgi:hypothetical protein
MSTIEQNVFADIRKGLSNNFFLLQIHLEQKSLVISNNWTYKILKLNYGAEWKIQWEGASHQLSLL